MRWALSVIIGLAMISGFLMLVEPVSLFLESGHVTREKPFPWIFLEEPIIAVTRYVVIFIVLSAYWGTSGVGGDGRSLFWKTIELYWVEFVVFFVLCSMLFFRLSALKSLALVLPFCVPAIQAYLLLPHISKYNKGHFDVAGILLISFVLITLAGFVHTFFYEYLVSLLT